MGSDVLVEREAKARRVRVLVTILLVGTVLSIVFHYREAFYLGHGYPSSTFLFRPEDHFNDWDNPYLAALAFLRGEAIWVVYFPFAILTTLAATIVPMRVGFAAMILAFLFTMVLMLRGWVLDCTEHTLTKVQYGFVLIVLAYPVLWVLDRANLEMLLFVLLAGFFYSLYVRGSSWAAAVFLAAAIAFKLYPATLLLLLLAERRYRTLAQTVGLAIGMTAVSTLLVPALGHIGPQRFWEMSSNGRAVYQNMMVMGGGGIQHGHTLWGLLRVPGFLSGAANTDWQMTLYEVAVALIFVCIAIHVVFRETERWKRVLLSIVPALLLPFVSADYTLIYLYFPIVFFINSPRVSRWDLVYVGLFGVLLIPVDYHYFALYADGISISVIVYPLAMIALTALAIVDRARPSAAELSATPPRTR
jgi:hypothetical protein